DRAEIPGALTTFYEFTWFRGVRVTMNVLNLPARMLKWFRRDVPPPEPGAAQLLKDAGIEVTPGWFSPNVKCVETPVLPVRSQAVEAESAIDPTAFPEKRGGHGIYGQWKLDPNKLPAYNYELDQRNNRSAYFMNSQSLDRRDHWHQIGNDHITALVSNDGVVQA